MPGRTERMEMARPKWMRRLMTAPLVFWSLTAPTRQASGYLPSIGAKIGSENAGAEAFAAESRLMLRENVPVTFGL